MELLGGGGGRVFPTHISLVMVRPLESIFPLSEEQTLKDLMQQAPSFAWAQSESILHWSPTCEVPAYTRAIMKLIMSALFINSIII